MWIGAGFIFFSVAPTTVWVQVVFLVLLSGALFLTISFVADRARYGVEAVLLILGYLLLRILRQDLPINIVLLVCLVATIETYFRQKTH